MFLKNWFESRQKQADKMVFDKGFAEAARQLASGKPPADVLTFRTGVSDVFAQGVASAVAAWRKVASDIAEAKSPGKRPCSDATQKPFITGQFDYVKNS